MSGNGRYPYAGMTGDPAKIIASANGCTDLPQPVELVDRAEDMEGQAARRGRLDWPGRRSPPDKSCLPACSDRCLHSLFHRGIRPAPARSLRHACARAWARSSRIQSAAPFWRIPAIPQYSHQPGDDWPETAHVAAAWPGSPPCWTASPATPKTWPGPAGPGNSRPRPCCPAVVLSAGGWPGRTWTSARSAAPGGCQLHAGADGTSLGCVAGRAVPPRGDRAAARLHRQPIPRALTTPARNSEAEHHCSGNWTP